ncbi:MULTISPECIES: hypothetical protein [unclassified Nocardiopsis]|uniref:hypothetical protein n=1 Tax=unclassified Nocardiopsis TaxID=2649073 RepID=UPI0009395924|nr:hypothetical protein [Nocardiopsis sp. TSRI0078]
MPEHRRPFSRLRSGLLALTLTVALGDPHALLVPRTPVPYAASAASSGEREGAPRPRGGGDRPGSRCPLPRKAWRSIIPHPRCHFD